MSNTITKQTKDELSRISELYIEIQTKVIDDTFKLSKSIDNEINKAKVSNPIINNLQRLTDYRLFIDILILDLTTSARIYLNAKSNYETTFSSRQIIVIINEGYKKIYHFIGNNKDYSENLNNRNNSFWVKNIGEIIRVELEALTKEYEELTNDLELYFQNNFEQIKIYRDLSIHYYENPKLVYAMLIELDLEETFKKMIPFLELLFKMSKFTKEMTSEYIEKVKKINLQAITPNNG